MITLDKWHPLVEPKQGVITVAFEKAVEKVQEEYHYALEANKLERKTLDLEIELYNKRAHQNTIELESSYNYRRFQIFI
jgi:hypothetical protein